MSDGVSCKSVQVPASRSSQSAETGPGMETTHQAAPLCYTAASYQLSVCFTCANARISVLLPQFTPPSPSPTVPTGLFSRYVALLLSNK